MGDDANAPQETYIDRKNSDVLAHELGGSDCGSGPGRPEGSYDHHPSTIDIDGKTSGDSTSS